MRIARSKNEKTANKARFLKE